MTSTLPAPSLWRGIAEVPAGFGPCVATIGVFDGVHRGHARLIEHAVRAGHTRRLPTVLLTFDPHPARVLGLRRDTATLTTVARRAELAGRLGVAAVCVLPFTREFATWSPATFIEQVLVNALNARMVAVGQNFTFGHRGAGDLNTLRELGSRYRLTAEGIGLVQERNERHSSTRIRACLRRGEVGAAARLLGRPHRVEGVVRATELISPPYTALPAPGRYVVTLAEAGPVQAQVLADGRIRLPAAVASDGPASVDFIAAAP